MSWLLPPRQPARLCQCHLPRYTFAGCENAFKTVIIIVGEQEVPSSDRILHVDRQRRLLQSRPQVDETPLLS